MKQDATSKTGYYSHPLSLLHDMGPGHPEHPGRLEAIATALQEDSAAARLHRCEPRLATRAELERIHTRSHVEDIFSRTPAGGLVHLDGDTAMNPHSLQAALLAAGAVLDATDRVIGGELANAFCCMRPPGHHAERNRAMGFCLFGNVAAGAAHALARHDLQRVAVLDFDVHHGNGTEDIFRDDERVLFCSSFQHPFYPYPSLGNAPAHIVHTPLPAGSDGAAFRDAVTAQWWPALERHRPEMIFVSAGFDAHREDPLGGLLLEDEDFAWVTREIHARADELCGGRIVSALEGGYNVDALARCVLGHLAELIG